MKRIFLLLLSGFIPLLSYAQSIKTIELTFSEDDFVFEQTTGGYDIKSPKYFVVYKPDSLSPALPFVVVNVLLDFNKEYGGFSFSYKEFLCKEDIRINTNKISRPTSFPASTSTSNGNVSYREAEYPNKTVQYTRTNLMGGYKYASFLVSPFRYNAASNKLFLKKSVSIVIQQNHSMNVSNPVRTSIGKYIQEIVINPQDITDASKNVANSELDGITDYDYIIVTNNTLKPVFQKLARWKTMKGVRTKVLTTESIYNNYDGDSPQIKIKKALKDYYNGQHHGLEYVLLGGDTEIIPTQMCFVAYEKYNAQGHLTYGFADSTPTDWFYGCFDVMDWDSNGNQLAGEVEDSVDLAAEVIVARLPASNYTEANIMVDRIIEYEKNPKTSNWNKNMLVCGSELDGKVSWQGDSISDVHYHYEYNHLYNGFPYWNVTVKRLFDTGTDFIGGANYNFTIGNLQEQLSKGYEFVNIDTHGVDTLINFHEYNLGFNMEGLLANGLYSVYRPEHANSLNNSSYSNILTSACQTNSFDKDGWECLSEAFLRNPQSRILSYIGSSRDGWNPESMNLNKAILQDFFSNSFYQVGYSFMRRKNILASAAHNYTNLNRWLLFSVNMLGDPENPIHPSKPEEISEEDIEFELYDGEFGIWANNHDATYCTMSRDDMGSSYYSSTGGYGAIYGTTDECTFCITEPGYIPYVGVYAPTVHLQNETIEGDYHVISRNTEIGSNVTNHRSPGGVVIKNGKTSLICPVGLTIYDNFEVKLGAGFEVSTKNW